MSEVKCGLVFPEHGTLWKIVNYSAGDGLWLVECCFDSSFTCYKKDEEVKKILGLPIDKLRFMCYNKGTKKKGIDLNEKIQLSSLR